jgi:hypothetical protein
MYFPKSQIKTNLYTNGGKYILSTTQEDYKGYYYETSNGTRYTGKTPQDGPNILLILPTNVTNPTLPQYSDPIIYALEGDKNENSNLTTLDNNVYFDLKKPKLTFRSLPLPNPTLPTQQDQNLGVFTRYFCKKNNELKYIEIDKTTSEKLTSKSDDIAWDLYTPVSTLWYIKGDKEKTYKANKGLISLIEQQKSWYGFTQWFKDKFLKYYLES